VHFIDEKLQGLIFKEINEYYQNYEDRDLFVKGRVLSQSVFLQVETSIYQSFINQFPLFKLLQITSIRIMKQNHTMMYNPIVLRKEQELDGIILVTRGQFQLYDDDMVLQNE